MGTPPADGRCYPGITSDLEFFASYIKSLGVECPLAKTGVKFVHHKAMEYDIGLYFEANGHGTVVFKDHVIKRLTEEKDKHTEEPKKTAAARLVAATQLINQAVGDAISDAPGQLSAIIASGDPETVEDGAVVEIQ